MRSRANRGRAARSAGLGDRPRPAERLGWTTRSGPIAPHSPNLRFVVSQGEMLLTWKGRTLPGTFYHIEGRPTPGDEPDAPYRFVDGAIPPAPRASNTWSPRPRTTAWPTAASPAPRCTACGSSRTPARLRALGGRRERTRSPSPPPTGYPHRASSASMASSVSGSRVGVMPRASMSSSVARASSSHSRAADRSGLGASR